MLDGVQCGNVGSTDIWRLAQIAIKVISPGVIRAGNRPSQHLRFLDKDYAPVVSHIPKHIDFTVAIACHDHRNAQKCDCLDHTWLADVLTKTLAVQLSRNRVSFS